MKRSIVLVGSVSLFASFAAVANAVWGELYDLDEDPHECHNLWDDAAHAGTRADLTSELVRQMTRHGETSPYPSALA